MTDTAVRVVDNKDDRRYEAYAGDALAGFVQYRTRPGRVVLVHTEIDPAFEGKGIASQLAAAALDDIRRQGLSVTPLCPFIASYIERHPDYADLVAAQPSTG